MIVLRTASPVITIYKWDSTAAHCYAMIIKTYTYVPAAPN